MKVAYSGSLSGGVFQVDGTVNFQPGSIYNVSGTTYVTSGFLTLVSGMQLLSIGDTFLITNGNMSFSQNRTSGDISFLSPRNSMNFLCSTQLFHNVIRFGGLQRYQRHSTCI